MAVVLRDLCRYYHRTNLRSRSYDSVMLRSATISILSGSLKRVIVLFLVDEGNSGIRNGNDTQITDMQMKHARDGCLIE